MDAKSSSSRPCCAATASGSRSPRRMDAFRALDLLGLGDRETVRARAARHAGEARRRRPDLRPALRSLLLRHRRGIREATAATQAALELDEADFQRLLERAGASCWKSRASSSRELAQALLRRATPAALEQLLREAAVRRGIEQIEHGVPGGPLQPRDGSRRSASAISARELDRLRRDLARGGPRRGTATATSISTRRLHDLQDLIKRLRAPGARPPGRRSAATARACRTSPRRASTISPRTRSGAWRRRSPSSRSA